MLVSAFLFEGWARLPTEIVELIRCFVNWLCGVEVTLDAFVSVATTVMFNHCVSLNTQYLHFL